jgi:hypothetical protein
MQVAQEANSYGLSTVAYSCGACHNAQCCLNLLLE